MQSTAARVTVGVVAIAIVVVAFIVLSGGDDSDDSTTNNTTPTVATTDSPDTGSKGDEGSKSDTGDEADAGIPVIQIEDGQPVGGVQDLSFNEGDDIKFEVESDTPDGEIHFHGYDIPQDLENGKTTFDVPATITGIFEVEIEDTATQIAQITVNP